MAPQLSPAPVSHLLTLMIEKQKSTMCMYVCMYVWRQRAALCLLLCPQPTFRFEGHKGDIRVRRTEQAGELFNDTCKDLTAGPVRFRNRNNEIGRAQKVNESQKTAAHLLQQERPEPGNSPALRCRGPFRTF